MRVKKPLLKLSKSLKTSYKEVEDARVDLFDAYYEDVTYKIDTIKEKIRDVEEDIKKLKDELESLEFEEEEDLEDELKDKLESLEFEKESLEDELNRNIDNFLRAVYACDEYEITKFEKETILKHYDVVFVD